MSWARRRRYRPGRLWSASSTSRTRREPDALEDLTASNNDLARRVRELEKDHVRDHLTLLGMQTRLEMQNSFIRAQSDYIRIQAAYSAMLAERLRALGQDVPPAPSGPPSPPPELSAPLVSPPAVQTEDSLPVILAALFNHEELEDLAFRIGARPEDLKGETISRRAVSLVLWARRREKLDQLVRLAKVLRPDGDF